MVTPLPFLPHLLEVGGHFEDVLEEEVVEAVVGGTWRLLSYRLC